MQIVIDIPESIYETIKEEEVGNVVYKAIKNGTPLAKIRAEIEDYKSTIDNAISEDELKIEGMKEAYTDCLEIIDEYKAESEEQE